MKVLLFIVSICFIVASLGYPTESEISADVVEDTEDTKRIHGGSVAVEKRFPYIVSIQFKKKNKFVKFCGGSIIDDNWILTAAHCCQHIKDENAGDITYVRAGVTEAFAETPGFQLRKIDKYFIYGAYKFETLQHDICLIKLKELLQYSSHVQKIDMVPQCTPATNRGFIMGFGQVAKGTFTENLHYAEVPLSDIDRCSDYYPHVLKAYHVCPGEPGKGSCQGDSGGPFVQQTADFKECLVALSSFARKKCEEAKMAAYLRVDPYEDWIKDTMAENA